MQDGATQGARFRRAFFGAAEVALMALAGCAGSNSPHSQGEATAGKSGMPSLAGAASADLTSNSNHASADLRTRAVRSGGQR